MGDLCQLSKRCLLQLQAFESCSQVSNREVFITIQGLTAQLNIWAANNHVFADGRGSLDHLVRRLDQNIQQVMVRLLEVLQKRLAALAKRM